MSADLAINLGGDGDAWSRLKLDSATCDLAERAAARAGLSVEEWLEQAIRRSSFGRGAPPVAPEPAEPAADETRTGSTLEAIVMPEALLMPLEDEVIDTEDPAQGRARGSKPLSRWAGRVVAAILAMAAGAVSAQYLIPDRGSAIHVALAPVPVEPLPPPPAAVPAPSTELKAPLPAAAAAPPPETAAPAEAAAQSVPAQSPTPGSPAETASAAPPQPASPPRAAATSAPSEKPPVAERKSVVARPTQQAAAASLPKPAPKPGKRESSAPSDPKQLAPWLQSRADNGDAVATYRLGVLYALGEGVTQDYERAATLFKTAAEDGVTEAEYNIAVMYAEGLGVERDPAQAVLWYRKAAAQGSSSAAFNLGVAASNGVGVKQNMAEAAQWFRKAGEAGVVNAQFNLGLLYERGEGLAASPVEAYAWYSAAASRGDTGAAQRRDRLASTLSPALLRDAQARAAQVQASIQASTEAAIAPIGASSTQTR